MADEQKRPKESTDGMIFIPNIDFKLEDLPETKPEPAKPVEKPKLSKGEISRAKKLVRAELDYVDTNNDGRLDEAELRASTDASAMANTASQTILAGLAQQFIKDATTNKKLNLPDDPNTAQYAPYLWVKPTTDLVIPDQVLTGRDIIKQSIVDRLHLDPKDVEKIMRNVLPNGIAEIRLSTECKHNEELLCEPAPVGNVRYSILPKGPTI